MGFDQSQIPSLSLSRDGTELVVAWATTAAAGTTFQVYLGRSLAWWGTATSARFPWPGAAGRLAIDVGAIDAGDAPSADFSGSLPAAPADRAQLTWAGGTYLSPSGDVAAFRIFASPTPGAAVSYAAPVATVPAYRGTITDGFGMGGFGMGGFGRAAGSYSWTSGPLAPGDWTFAVSPVDSAGNSCAAPTTATATIAGPPRPPAADAVGTRLSLAYNPATGVATLSWLPSPS
jgi:hypothetical protein